MSNLTSQTILLVEDEALIAFSEQRLLEREGYSVLLAGDGESTVELVRQDGARIDLILMDINLGPGLDGPQAASEILKEWDIPIIFLSSHTEKEVVEKVEKISSYGYVVKNSNPAVLFASIKMAFKLHAAHQKIRESENSYRRLVEGLPDVVYQYSSQRGGVFYSTQVENILGYTREQLYARPFLWNQSIHPDDIPLITDSLQKFENGAPLDIEYRIQDAQGKWHWLRDRSIGRYQNGDETLIEGLASDLTEQKQTQASLQAKTDELDHYFNASLDLFCIADLDGSFRHLNNEWERTLGYSIQDLEGTHFMQYVHPDDLENTNKVLSQLNTQSPVLNFENRYRCKDGSYRWIEWRSMPHGSAIYAAARDITQRKEIEAQLLESQKMYQLLAENVSDVIWIFDLSDNCFRYISPSIMRLRGFSVEEALRQSLTESLTPESLKDIQGKIPARLQTFEPGKTVFYIDDVSHLCKDGSTIWAETTTSFQRNDKNGHIEIYGVSRNITDRKRSQAVFELRLELLEFAVDHSLDELMQTALDKITALTDSPIGFFHFVEADQQSLALQAWSTRTLQEYCRTEGKGLHYDLSKAGIWADCVRQRKPIIHNEYASEPGKKGLPEGHAALMRELVVPVFRGDKVVSILGIGNKASPYLDQDVETVMHLADVVWEIVQRKKSEQALTDVESLLKLFSHNLKDVGLFIYTKDLADGVQVEYLSPGMEVLTGVSMQEAVQNASRLAEVILPEYMAQIVAMEAKAQEDMQNFALEMKQRHAQTGEIRWMFSQSTPLRRADGSTVFYGVQIDISQRKQTEEKVQALLQEKETLLKEVHHRIKNNLNTIASLLFMQAEASENEVVRQALQEAEVRVNSMMILYDRLYRTENFSALSLNEYLPPLLEQVVEIFARGSFIQVQTDLKVIHLAPKQLYPLGIILNELATNSLKHAYPNGSRGIIKVSAALQENRVQLVYEDDGIGISENLTPEKTSGFGLRLVHLLVKQIGGTIQIEKNQGTRVTIGFSK